MYKIFIIVQLFLLVFMSSCGIFSIPPFSVPFDIKRNFTNCYDGKNTGIDTLINIRGFYRISSIRENQVRYTTKGEWVHKIDTSNIYLMFFEDGLFAYNIFNKKSNYNEVEIKDTILHSTFWGSYKVFGDTIKVQYINYRPPYADPTWAAYENWFVVIDRNTIHLVYSELLSLPPEAKSQINYNKFGKRKNDIAIFTPLELSLSSDCWLKNRKWFWCNKKLYDEFKVKKK